MNSWGSERTRVVLRIGALVIAVVAIVGVVLAITHTSKNQTSSNNSAPGGNTSTGEQTADRDGLVAARHPDCAFGPQMLRYLQTGNNSGNPWYDQHYANDVGEPLPQARADIDQAIQQCDKGLDDSAASVTSSIIESSAEASKQAQQANDTTARQAACKAIGGHYDESWGWCASDVQGEANGQVGDDCSYASVSFQQDTNIISQTSLADVREQFPGCFP